MKTFSLLLSTVIFASAMAAAPGSFTMKWEQFPADAKGCTATADRLADAFENAYGIAVDLAVGAEKENNCRIAITYTATEKKGPITTDTKIPFGEEGWRYASLRQCQADVMAQTKLFRAETGLEPYTAHCYSNLLNGGPVSHTLRIESFGNALKTVRTVRAPRAYRQQKFFNANLRKALVAKGATVFREAAAPNPQGAMGNDWFHVYAPATFTVPNSFGPWLDKISFSNPRDCESERANAEKIVTAAGGTVLAGVCADSKDLVNKTVFHLIYDGANELVWEKPPIVKYKTLAQCQEDQKKTIAYFEEKLAKTVAGAYCFIPQVTNDVVMYVITKKAL